MAGPGLPHDYYMNPPAYMGYVGFVKLVAGGHFNTNSDLIVRATSADVNLKQSIEKPDVIDSRFDRTVYQLGPQLVEGSFSFPAVYDQQGGANVVASLYQYCVARRANPTGILWDFDVDVKYAGSYTSPNQAEFRYHKCIVNSWKFSVAQQETINISCDIIGLSREFLDEIAPPPVSGTNAINNTRIVTWNDARVEIREGSRGGFGTIGGQFVRSFEANINNNAERFYTLNKELFAQAIAPTKRDVTGSLVLMGRHEGLANLAWDNQNYCFEDTSIAFGFQPKATGRSGVGGTCDSTFSVLLPNIVFEIEEMSLTNSLFETTVNWHSLPAAGTSLNATTGAPDVNGVYDPLINSLNNTTFTY